MKIKLVSLHSRILIYAGMKAERSVAGRAFRAKRGVETLRPAGPLLTQGA